MKLTKVIFIGALTSTMLLGCGGGGGASKSSFGSNYDGKRSPATIDESNSSEIAESSISVTRALTVGDSLSSIPIGIEVESIGKDVARHAVEVALRNSEGLLGNLPVAVEATESGSCGGYFRFSGDDTKFTVNFYNYCTFDSDLQEIVTLNGKMAMELSGDDFEITLTDYRFKTSSEDIVMTGNISLTTSGDTEVFIMNVTGSNNGVTDKVNFRETCNTRTGECSLEQEITVANGTTYLVEDAQVTSYSSRWNINAKFYDPFEGSVSMNAQNIVFCADGRSIQSGLIYITDNSNNQLSLMFTSCSEMTVSVNSATANVLAQ